MTFSEYLRRLDAYRRANPSQRYGQAVFNVLDDAFPEFFRENQIHGSKLDPFYDNDRVVALLSLLHSEGLLK